jgi:hypothetical protein
MIKYCGHLLQLHHNNILECQISWIEDHSFKMISPHPRWIQLHLSRAGFHHNCN